MEPFRSSANFERKEGSSETSAIEFDTCIVLRVFCLPIYLGRLMVHWVVLRDKNVFYVEVAIATLL